MTTEQKKKAEKKIMFLSFGVLGLAVVFLIFVGITGQAETLLFPVGLGAFLAVYWMISDLLPVKWADIFDGKTEEQKKAYWMFALLDAGGLAGLVYFILDMESMLGVIIFAGCTMMKRKFSDTFAGKTEDADSEQEEIVEASAELPAAELTESTSGSEEE